MKVPSEAELIEMDERSRLMVRISSRVYLQFGSEQREVLVLAAQNSRADFLRLVQVVRNAR